MFGYTGTYQNDISAQKALNPIPAFVTRINGDLTAASHDLVEAVDVAGRFRLIPAAKI